MWKHLSNEHRGNEEKIDFDVKVVKKFKKPISRQINEALRISGKKKEENLNSKKEYNGNSLKTLVLNDENKFNCSDCDYKTSSKQIHTST